MTNNVSPTSAGAAFPSSSPRSAGTGPTEYSPLLVRNGAQRSSNAAGKQPARADPFPSSSITNPPVFLNELNPAANGFISRYLEIVTYPNGSEYMPESLKYVEESMKIYNAFKYSVPLNSSGNIRLRFDSIRDACEGQQILTSEKYGVEFITQRAFAMAKFQDVTSLDEFEGSVKFEVTTIPSLSGVQLAELTNIIREYAELAASNHVRDLIHAKTEAAGNYVFRVEYVSIDAANRVVQVARMLSKKTRNSAQGTFQWSVRHCSPWTGTSMQSNDSTPPRDDRGRLVGFLHQDIPVGLHRRSPGDSHNRVRRDRILDGSDIRTTVMLRNIPNKMDFLTLKALLDRFCFGSYDFLYLRIDFKSGCNVGYAFINLTDVAGMISMLDNVEGRGWPGFRSQKAAELSYATIQGKEALTQKFRNSSVMSETPYVRPRLYHSLTDAEVKSDIRWIGQETRFPNPDNQAKLQRSIDSARTVGLYAPNNGQCPDQRTREGMLDAGNPREAPASPYIHIDDVANMHFMRAVESAYNYHNINSGSYIPYHEIPQGYVRAYMQGLALLQISIPGVIGQRAPSQARRFDGQNP